MGGTLAEHRAELSAREQEVLGLTAGGLTNREIGERLSLSVKTVDTYRARDGEAGSAPPVGGHRVRDRPRAPGGIVKTCAEVTIVSADPERRDGARSIGVQRRRAKRER